MHLPIYLFKAIDYFINASGLKPEDRKRILDMHVSFDGGHVEQGLFINKSTDILEGGAYGCSKLKMGEVFFFFFSFTCVFFLFVCLLDCLFQVCEFIADITKKKKNQVIQQIWLRKLFCWCCALMLFLTFDTLSVYLESKACGRQYLVQSLNLQLKVLQITLQLVEGFFALV